MAHPAQAHMCCGLCSIVLLLTAVLLFVFHVLCFLLMVRGGRFSLSPSCGSAYVLWFVFMCVTSLRCVMLCVSDHVLTCCVSFSDDGQRGQGLSAHPVRVRRRTNCNRAGALLGNGRRPSSYSHQLTILIPYSHRRVKITLLASSYHTLTSSYQPYS